METNEIKSLRIKVPLKDYLFITDTILSTKFKIGRIEYFQVKPDIQCQNNISNDVLLLLGVKVQSQGICLFEVNKTIEEIDFKNVSIYKDFVLKEQIKDLKYIEQTELFKEDEQRKD